MTWFNDVTLEVSLGFGSGPFATAPTWTNIYSDVRWLEIRRGRNNVQRPFDAGTGRIIVDNTDGDFDPNNSTSPYAGNLKLGTPVRIRATYSAVTHNVFRGYVSRWPLTFEQPNESHAALEITETFALVRRASLAETSYSQQSTDARIGAILDDVGWPAAWRDLETGVTDQVAALTFTGRAGSLLDDTVDAEQGQLFQAKDGDITFYNRVHYTGASAGVTFTDTGAGLAYANPEFRYDDDLLVNEAYVTGADGLQRSATDATSITTYGPSAEGVSVITNDTILSAPYALNIAEWLVLRYKDAPADVRIGGFTLYPQANPSGLYPQALGRELGDGVNLEYTPPAGDTFDQDVRIDSISHDISPGVWVTRFGCDRFTTIETQQYWILGTSQLGNTTRLA